jgi:hypothetical protein
MYPYVFAGEESGWSNTQILTISLIPSPSPEPTPVTEIFPATLFLVAASVGTALAIIGLLVYFKKRNKS